MIDKLSETQAPKKASPSKRRLARRSDHGARGDGARRDADAPRGSVGAAAARRPDRAGRARHSRRDTTAARRAREVGQASLGPQLDSEGPAGPCVVILHSADFASGP